MQRTKKDLRHSEENIQFKFAQLMAKDWQNEFNQIAKTLNKITKRNRIYKKIERDPAAYFTSNGPDSKLLKQSKPKVKF